MTRKGLIQPNLCCILISFSELKDGYLVSKMEIGVHGEFMLIRLRDMLPQAFKVCVIPASGCDGG